MHCCMFLGKIFDLPFLDYFLISVLLILFINYTIYYYLLVFNYLSLTSHLY